MKKRFIDTIQRYQDIERNYQMKYCQRLERQIRIGKKCPPNHKRVNTHIFKVNPNANQDEIDDIIDADNTPQIFAQSVKKKKKTVLLDINYLIYIVDQCR